MILALGLKYKPPSLNSNATTVRNSFDIYCNAIRKANAKSHSSVPSLQVRVMKYIYQQHYNKGQDTALHTAINENFGILMKNYFEQAEQKMHRVLKTFKYREPTQNKDDRIQIQRAMRHIKERHDLIFQATDKNLGIACIDKTTYIQAGYAKLNTDNYQKVETYDVEQIVREYINIFKELGLLTIHSKCKCKPLKYQLPLDWTQFDIN
jgi:hypothetical protein